MHITIRRYRGVTGSRAEIERGVQGAIPLLKQAPGYIGWYFVDAGNGTWASVSIFEDQAGAEQSTRIAGDYIRQHMAQHIPNPPEVTMGEVVVQGGSR